MSTSSNSISSDTSGRAGGKAGPAPDTGLHLRAAPWSFYATLVNELINEVESVRASGGLQQPGVASKLQQLRSRQQSRAAS